VQTSVEGPAPGSAEDTSTDAMRPFEAVGRKPNAAAARVVPNARAETDQLGPDDARMPRSQPGPTKSDPSVLFDQIIPFGGADASAARGVPAASVSHMKR
jgi:hypothetical protein